MLELTKDFSKFARCKKINIQKSRYVLHINNEPKEIKETVSFRIASKPQKE